MKCEWCETDTDKIGDHGESICETCKPILDAGKLIGFEAGAAAMREVIAARSVDFDDDPRRFGALVRAVPLPTPTTKGGA